jgi:alpha-beta hydrolase superfamily lysophospholipase
MIVAAVLVAGFAVLLLLGILLCLALVAMPAPSVPRPKDVFGFSHHDAESMAGLPPLDRYSARDGERPAYRFYACSADRILIFIHGSSYHGLAYHDLAVSLSAAGVAKVVLPNLRGHFQSGRHRGDVDYIGQLEDDIADLIAHLRRTGLGGPITLGGHSSGGGLVLRFAGGAHARQVADFLVLCPIIPNSPSIRGGTAGGWATAHRRRIAGLVGLNALGIRGFNGLPIVEFGKPVEFWDGTETLTYSFRLNASYHPRFRYQDDLRRLGERATILVGAADEAIEAGKLQALFRREAPEATFEILAGINHFGIFAEPAARERIAAVLIPAG